MLPRSQTQASGICLQCRQVVRAFSTGRVRQTIGPEHPKYIDIPEPPQQTSYRPEDIKGILPVPRPLFAGKRGIREARDQAVDKATLPKSRIRNFEENSFDAWKAKVAEQRKENLRSGTVELRSRSDRSNARRDTLSKARTVERRAAALRPEREDERLTTDSNNFDLASLMRGEVQDADKEMAFQRSQARYNARETRKAAQRQDHLHTLYAKATKFIVSPEQLDEALETAFGTDDKPVVFSRDGLNMGDIHSIWAEGKPEDTSDMLYRTTQTKNRNAPASNSIGRVQGGATIDQVAEALTGGALGERPKGQGSSSSDLFSGI